MERMVDFKNKTTDQSPLMAAKSQASSGEKFRRCPYGCDGDDLDEHSYCRHVIGFTIPGDNKRYEPRKRRFDREGKPSGWYVDGKDVRDVPKGASLDRITVSSRVYTEEGLPTAEAELEALTKPGS